MVLPEFTIEGDLPAGVYVADWRECQARFGAATARRVWLFSRFQALVALAAQTGKLRRVFVWGSFVTAKPAPKDVDILLLMDADFEVERVVEPARIIFDAARAKLLFESDVFWARASIGEDVLKLWLDTSKSQEPFENAVLWS